ncbi:hypothetical protein BpHYR1_022272 [Brachionus plicatilis]|uniref:Uncharacterized protein n=1 Tax=Brachionus plicatilis TaxID=10195 RepID=A0A3M7REJ4_BRAPC|nr:hypothetical protein BpHYR1_022272 [Brachionus plicatilis]
MTLKAGAGLVLRNLKIITNCLKKTDDKFLLKNLLKLILFKIENCSLKIIRVLSLFSLIRPKFKQSSKKIFLIHDLRYSGNLIEPIEECLTKY